MKIGFVIALPQELRTLTRKRARPGEVINLSPHANIILSSMGSVNAAAAANKHIESGATLLISWGCCAGLRKDLDAGTIVIPSNIIPANGDSIIAGGTIREKLIDSISRYATIDTGPIAEAENLLRNADYKRELYHKTKAVAADMESAAIAKIANNKNIDFIAIRAIADDANTVMPSCIEKAMNEDGGVNMFSFLINLLKHPSELKALIHVANGFNYAQKALKQIAKPCLDHLQPKAS